MDTVKIKSDGVPSFSASPRPAAAPPAFAQGGTSSIKDPEPQQQWDSTIGKASLGKTGRVINKLVSENEALKRDLKIERLRAEEAREATKLTQDKMQRIEQEYESKLLDASVTKTLLARKERKVEELGQAIEVERRKAQAAHEREQSWKAEMERAQRDNTAKVEEAVLKAQLMEGRYNAISGHWKDQGETLSKGMAKLRLEVAEVNEERRRDDGKINTLRDLCEQQDSNIRELIRQKEAILAHFEAYKLAQEDALREIKENARRAETQHEALLEETRKARDKFKWALSIHNNQLEAQKKSETP
jgi:hypothetical protein